MKAKLTVLAGASYLFLTKAAGFADAQDDQILIKETDLGFRIPNFSTFLSFAIKFLFVVAGLMALFYMLWGALSWVMSGGDEGKVGAAQKKIIAAVVGVILIVATLSLVVALEQVVFKESICFGISCPLTLPDLLQKTADPSVDADDDGLDNNVDNDVDGDGTCNSASTDPNANPGKNDPSCKAGPDVDIDGDGTPNAREAAGCEINPKC